VRAHNLYQYDKPCGGSTGKGSLRVYAEEWSNGSFVRKFRADFQVSRVGGGVVQGWTKTKTDGYPVPNLDPGDYRVEWGTYKDEDDGAGSIPVDPWWSVPGPQTATVEADKTKEVWGHYERAEWWPQVSSRNYSGGLTLESGQEAVLEVVYRNHGWQTWRNYGSNQTNLGTWDPQDRNSAFVTDDWLGGTRPGPADQSDIGAEGEGHFAFRIRAPQVSAPTDYREAFALVVENVRWLNDIGDAWKVEWNIHVNPPSKGTLSVTTNTNSPVGVAGEVFVNGTSCGMAPQSRQVDVGSYTVTFGAQSGWNTPPAQSATVTSGNTTTVSGTYTDTTPPTLNSYSTAPNSPSNAAVVHVEVSASDGASGLDRREVWADGAKKGNAPLDWDTSGTADGSHSVELKAFDRAGNSATQSFQYFLDRAAPTTPTDATAQRSCNQVPLSWSPSTDPGYPTTGVGMDGYHVFRALFPDGAYTQIATVAHAGDQLAFTDTNAHNVTTYRYRISAFDKVTNESAPSEPLTFTAGLLGDVNGDCSADVSDFVKGIRLALFVDPGTYGQRDLGDLNRDGAVDIVDLVRLRNGIFGRSRQAIRPERTADSSPWDSSLGTRGAATYDQVLWNSTSSQGRLSPDESAVPSGLTVDGGSIAIPGVNSFAILSRSLRDGGRAAGNAAMCRLSLGAARAGEGVTEVPLFLHGDRDVAGVQVEVRFDPALVEVIGVRPGALLGGGWEVQSNVRAPGRLLVLAHAGLNGAPVSGGAAGVLAWVQVRVVDRARAAALLTLAGNAKAVTPAGEPLSLGAQESAGLTAATTRLCGGWHLLAPPLESATGELGDLFGPLPDGRGSGTTPTMVTYGWTGTQYVLNPPVELGKAYWAFLPQARDLTAVGRLPASDAATAIRLQQGWNLIGLPRNGEPVQWSACTVIDVEGAVKPAAGTDSPLAPCLWRWRPESAEYVAEWTDIGSLSPWEGRWVLALRECAVLLPAEGGVEARDSRSVTSNPAGFAAAQLWSVELSLTASRARSTAIAAIATHATAGFDGFRAEAPSPPPSPNGVSLHFVHPEWQSRTAGATAWFAADTREPLGLQPTVWSLEATAETKTTATLLWPDLSELPKDVTLTLVDLDTGEQRYLRTTRSYEFSLSPGKPRRFQLVAERGASAPLRISNVVVVPGRAGGVTVRYALSKPALVQATIRSASGRVVGTMSGGRAVGAGLNALTWDSRAAGKALPRGVYLIELTARTEDGQVARAVRTFRCP
jgi:hypothetical protein